MKAWRVSNVERFRQYELDEDAEVADLIADICGWSEGSTAMRAGTAFHKALELSQTDIEVETLTADGFTFHFPESMSVELATIREVRASKTYMVDGRPIVISGQLDQIDGKTIHDHKTTGRFDADRYIEGYQWRLYLDIFGADRFRWNVFEIAEKSFPPTHNQQENGGPESDGLLYYEVKAAHRLEQCRYPTLGADCQALVERFARFVRDFVEVPA